MLYTRVHRNGFQVILDKHPSKRGWWSIHSITRNINGARSKSLRMLAPTLEEAKEMAERLAVLNHACTSQCQDGATF